MTKLKTFNVYIDISETMSVKAKNNDDAVNRIVKQLEDAGTIWTLDDAEVFAEEDK